MPVVLPINCTQGSFVMSSLILINPENMPLIIIEQDARVFNKRLLQIDLIAYV